MKILWISNVIFPEACKEINIQPSIGGGWIHSSAIAFIETNPNVKLCVASLYSGKELIFINKYQICYYLIPSKGGDQTYNTLIEAYYIKIKSEFKPDIVHIHGSEYPHSLAWVKACGVENVVVSIQGLVSVYANYYLGGITSKEIKDTKTIRDIIRKDSLFDQQKRMHDRGKYEKELLSNVNHIIGRTSWDRSNTWAINPNAKYHFCNEVLRNSFYNFRWDNENCLKYSIFLSQAHYPIKGIQQIIKALPTVLKYFPDTQVYVAGNNFLNSIHFKRNGFANYLKGLLNSNNVIQKFTFLGPLEEIEMVNQYLKANIFVCPSYIENSPNSIGEAQLLGTPVIASYVGGNMDMINNEHTGFLYRYEETELLAMRICELFDNINLARSISVNERLVASVRHDRKSNSESLIGIYNIILNENLLYI